MTTILILDMQNIYFGAIVTAMTIFMLAGLLLFLQRKRGERSRMILAGMSFLSMINYIGLIVYYYIDPTYCSGTILDIPFLLIGIFVMTIYLMYPIEVISPGWLTWKRLIKMYIPVLGLWLLYRVTLWLGVEYTSYKTIGEMATDIWSFQVIFRILLVLLIFLSTLLLYYIPYTRRYNNTSPKWMRGYIVVVIINMLSYIMVNIIDTFFFCSIYVAISVMCSLYFTYQELFVRLIRQSAPLPQNKPQPIVEIEHEDELKINTQQATKTKETELFERLELYMNNTHAWQDPDLSVEKLTSVLYTNRTMLLKAIQEHCYRGYPNYVNGKRVADFINIINKQEVFNYQQTFFDVGFRSKTSALRNFKEITGMTPSEYFQNQNRNK